MGFASRALVVFLVLPLAAADAAAVDNQIRDTAARIDFGFYTADAGLIAAARDAVDSYPANPWNDYLRAYAAYRQAQLALLHGRPAGDSLDACSVAAEAAADSKVTEAEALVLLAACAGLAASAEPVRAVLHQRRYRRTVARLELVAPENPRYLLIAYTMADGFDDESRPAADALIDAFAVEAATIEFPDWGEAEALTAIGAARLVAGDRRGARDLIEQALLNAPDYHAALRLEAMISGSASPD
jgi:hypothetical protein